MYIDHSMNSVVHGLASGQKPGQAKPHRPSQAKPNVMAWSWLWPGFGIQKPKPSQQAMALEEYIINNLQWIIVVYTS